jgi:hypothetical protein
LIYNGLLRPGLVGVVPDDVGVLGGRQQEVRRFGDFFAGDLDQRAKLFPYLEKNANHVSKAEDKTKIKTSFSRIIFLLH